MQIRMLLFFDSLLIITNMGIGSIVSKIVFFAHKIKVTVLNISFSDILTGFQHILNGADLSCSISVGHQNLVISSLDLFLKFS